MKSEIKAKIGVCLALGMSVILSACSKDTNETNPNLLLARNIVSTRAQNTSQFLAVLKLKNPALLEEARS